MPRGNLWDQVDGDLYAILGVSPNSSADGIVSAWRSTAKRLHPDAGGSVESFQRAEVAYEVLSNPLERSRYDRLRTAGPTANQHTTQPPFRTTHQAWPPPNANSTTYTRHSTSQHPDNPYAAPSFTSMAKKRGWSLWSVLAVLLFVGVVLLAAVTLAVVTPLILIGFVIWAVGRSLTSGGRSRK